MSCGALCEVTRLDVLLPLPPPGGGWNGGERVFLRPARFVRGPHPKSHRAEGVKKSVAKFVRVIPSVARGLGGWAG